MGLFDMRYCDICGNKISLLGNRKLEDGNMCADCEKKLSRWFRDRRHATAAMIREQLAYREENAAAVEAFKPTRKLGTAHNRFFLLDDTAGKFIVLREGEAMDKNPDVFDRAKVRNPLFHIEGDTAEDRCRYRFLITMNYDSEFFREISFALTDFPVDGGWNGEEDQEERTGSAIMKRQNMEEYKELEALGNEILSFLRNSCVSDEMLSDTVYLNK